MRLLRNQIQKTTKNAPERGFEINMVLDVRLGAAADLVPKGARLADIGSDHAYLPIALCLEGKINCALASDINDGPVAAAVANISPHCT